MVNARAIVISALALLYCVCTARGSEAEDATDPAVVSRIHDEAIVIDSHADTTQKLRDPAWDFSMHTDSNQVDLPLMRKGGLDAVFLSIWTDREVYDGSTADAARQQISAVRGLADNRPDDLVLATTANDMRTAARNGKIAVLLGVEGGHMIEDNLDILREFAASGVRYMTLTHQSHTHWADSSGTLMALKPLHNGLTDFGKTVVLEMNRLGMLVDVSHVSDATFWSALKVSRAPIIASHSACRALVDSPRNMSDEMIRAMAAKGGVIQILFTPMYVDSTKVLNLEKRFATEVEAINRKFDGDPTRAAQARAAFFEQVRSVPTTVAHVVDHIEHVVQLVGDDFVGIGGDWDNFSAAGPMVISTTRALGIKDVSDGLEDVSKLPALTGEMLRRGYDGQRIRKVLGGNLLRVMELAERTALQFEHENN